ncbi:protein NO VEIN domain-containing protein [Cellulosimicrobium sp. I38E]|uniref:protein NO VEIN domain-containing protein n=1 Tax=Cellulosimicrobium sp. I38E TaxID=1393139 RepID=UPI0007B19CA5|nr:DUF3883 domain-containing protein [Cellulosimicrobium sp. I38E]KZM78448.1 hypothetical protein A0J59_13310 [Cellulosimicrobium sp. I38E]
MAINEWWTTDVEQRFWMEITDRDDLGADLIAPMTDGSGRSYWGYELITYVQPGDVVLHWHKTLADEPGIVGWSQATGAYEDTNISWQAHGTVGRAKGSLKPRPAWRMPLLHYTSLTRPVLISEVRRQERELRKALAELETQYPEGRLYFPFGFSDKRELRAQQTYFVKMPREVLQVLGLEGLEGLPRPKRSTSSDGTGHPKGKTGKRGDSGYIADSAVRSAIEWRAVDLAVEAYELHGFVVTYTGASKPYDLAVEKGGDRRHVEVKGSSGAAATVELTHGEVNNSRVTVPTDLFVVDGIQWWREADGSVKADGGDVRWWKDWTADDEQLKAIRFRYTLPAGGK